MIFSREADPQQRSQLVKLPTEIRLMILRLLLVHGGPLRARKWRPRKRKGLRPEIDQYHARLARRIRERHEGQLSSYHLSPQILATCQTLFNEGCPLLYSSNTLGLQIRAVDVDYESDSEAEASRACCGCGIPTCSGGMFVYAIPYVCARSNDTDMPAKILNILQKFDKLQIDINHPTKDDRHDHQDRFDDLDDVYENTPPSVRRTLLRMAKILRNKIVDVKFINPERADDAETVRENLEELMLLRCKEFKILNTELPASKVSATTEVVTSNRPVLNLHEMFENLRAYFEAFHDICPCSRDCCQADCYDEEMWEIRHAVHNFNMAEFLKLRAELMEKIDKGLKRVEKLKDHILEENVTLDDRGLPASAIDSPVSETELAEEGAAKEGSDEAAS